MPRFCFSMREGRRNASLVNGPPGTHCGRRWIVLMGGRQADEIDGHPDEGRHPEGDDGEQGDAY